MSPVCSIEGCEQPVHVRGWCERHYRRWLHNGDPLAGRPDSVARYATTEDLRERMARAFDQIHNPIGLARKYLAKYHLLGGRDEDDLIDAAVDAIVDAALSWDPHGGRSIVSWAWVYMERNIPRELARCVRRHAELGAGLSTQIVDWARHDPALEDYHRVELRVDLQRWADLAELTPLMRFIVEYAALHYGTIHRQTPLDGIPSPLQMGASATYRLALNHMRRAAVTGQRRDDRWTRMRAWHGDDLAALRRSNAALAELQALEAIIVETLAS